jgi:conjugal transfer mating pair stabilization protein TraG
MPEFEVYTTGGGFYLYDIFNFLALFTSGSAFQDMLVVGIILGVFYMVTKMTITGSIEGVLPYIATVAVVGALGIGPKARVIVMDSTYPLEIYGTVDNVPYSVALVANLTTKTSYDLTRRMEALLSTPDNLVYQEHGILFGASLMAQAARWRAVTASVHQNLVGFMENCIVDGTNIGLVDLDALVTSGDLASFISTNVPGALAYYDEVAQATTGCAAGWAGLEAELGDEVIRILQARAASRAPQTGNAAGTVEVNALTGTLEDFQNMMGLAGYSATSYLKQSMLVLALDDAAGRLIANSGNAAAMELYQAARAESQTRSSYQIVGANATKWVPLLKVTFETLYYGAFPLAMLLMMTPMAASVARGYFGGYVWLASWEPLSAILHTTLLKASTGWYREHTTTLSGTNTIDVLNWANHFGIQSVEQDVGMVAGYLMMSVPFLGFALMFGASKMAGLATSMLNVSQGAAIETGREAATGSLSLGNVSMNNMSANKWNTSALMDNGRATRVMGDGGMVTSNSDGTRTYSSGSAQSNVGMNASVGQSVREEVSDRSSQAWRAVETQSEDFAQSVSKTASQLSDFGKTVTESQTAGGEIGWSASEEQRSDVRNAWSEVERFASTHNLSTDVALQAMLAGSAGVGGGEGIKLAANLEARGMLAASSQESFTTAVDAARDGSYSETLGLLSSSSQRGYSGTHSSEVDTGSNSIRSNLENVMQSAQRLSSAYEQAESLDRTEAYLESQDMGYNAKITDAVIGKLRDEGYSDERISMLVNPKTAAGLSQQQEVLSNYLPDIMRDLGLDKGTMSEPQMMQNNSGLYRDMAHTPVDHSSADVAKPQMGEYRERSADAERASGVNFDHVYGGMSEARITPDRVDGKLDTGSEIADRSVGRAFADRGAGILGLETDWMPDAGVQASQGQGNEPATSPTSTTASTHESGASLSLGLGGRNTLTNYDRDVVARTILGEAAGESEAGMAAVASVIKNRVEDPRWGDDPADVALQMQQFSTWNAGAGGNDQAVKYHPGDPEYERAAKIADLVFGGQIADQTGGATHYYSPQGMQDLVEQGAQTNEAPNWLQEENNRRGGAPVVIGDHVFTGKADK